MKYIIEIEDRPMFAVNGDMLWRAKDFKSLVFDSDGLAKLQPYPTFTLSAGDVNIGKKQPQKKVNESKSVDNSKDSVRTRLDNRLKESAQTKLDNKPEEYKKAVIEAVKKLANTPVDKTVNKSEEPKKSEESKKPGETKKTISPDTWEVLTERYRKALGRLDRTLKFDDTLDDLTSVVNYFLEIFGD